MSSSTAQPRPAVSAAAPSESLWPEPSELDTTLLGSSVPPSSAEAPLAWAWSAACQWVAFFRGLTLAAASAASGAVAASSFALLVFLAITASLAPASDTFSRPLSLDFSQSDLLAQAVFLPEAQLVDGMLPPADLQRDARFLPPGQAVDVWAELLVPRSAGQGLAQVVAQLASLDGRVAAKASRVVELRVDPWSLRSLSLAPLRWLGLASSLRRVRVPLFHGYREKREVPFMTAQVAIKTRNPSCAPEVMSATLKVRLRLGWLRRAIYWMRPGRLALPLLGAAAVAALAGGSTAALVFVVLLFLTGIGGGREARGAAADEVGSVAASEDVEVSSMSGVSEASSSLLRQLSEEEGEPPSPGRQAAGLPAAAMGFGRSGTKAAAAAAVDRWQDSLLPTAAGGATGSSASGAAVPAVGAGRQRPAKAAGGPADSAMGSEPGGIGGLLAGGMRRRAGSSGAKPASSL